AEQIVYSDPSCLDVSWDVICQAAYNSCIGTCDDGVQNGEETGIDCGGPDCPECIICEENELKLSIVTDGWGAETTWVLFDSEGGQVESGGPYVNEFNDGEYPQPDVFICVPDGCYDFTIYDSAGDGQCCAYGFGSYSLTLDGEVLASGGEFDDSETTNFCLGDTGPDCSVFDTPPTDLTKSFDPVNGIQDRVQVKWFKASPQVKYSDADAAACDIKFWPKRNLDPVTGNVTGDPIVAAPGDTINILDTKKFQQDGVTPREIFKWPVKFRKNSDNPNAKRADANIRYQWQVRCACLHGEGPESPWSDIKIFNTPDFDPETGIFTPPGDVLVANDQAKLHGASVSLNAFPNPNNGEGLNLDISDLTLETSMVDVQIIDITGKQIQAQRYSLVKSNDYLEIRFDDRLKTGMYFIILQEEGKIHHTRFMVKN
ncbi:MAG: T9SS type A sorting domain-containing protein, partial [Flavobacteriales bacterium]|nr:T9SS type A sorting domain-containing protein [Flavobacteriales bacterium]